jgi:hypothetical protein
MRKLLAVLLFSAAFFLTGCPAPTPSPIPEQACIWQPEASDIVGAPLIPTPTHTGAAEPITPDNVNHIAELARLGRGDVFGVYPGADPNTRVILSEAGAEVYDTERRHTVRWFHQIAPATDDVVSPDGRLLIGTRDAVLRLWDLTDGRLLCEMDAAPYRGVASVAWSPDGK